MKLSIILLLLSATGYTQGRNIFMDSVRAKYEIKQIYSITESGYRRIFVVWEEKFSSMQEFDTYSQNKAKVSRIIARAYITEVLNDKPARFRLGIQDETGHYISHCGVLE